MFICFERERAWAEEEQRERGRERESLAGSTLSVQSLTQSSNSQNWEIMTWAEIKSQTLNWPRHPRTPIYYYYFYFYLFIYFFNFWDRERQSISRGGSEREGDTEFEASSRLWAIRIEPDEGLKLTNRETMTWAKVGCSTDWATQVPLLLFFKILFYFIIF